MADDRDVTVDLNLPSPEADAAWWRERAEWTDAQLKLVTLVLRIFANADAHENLFWQTEGDGIRMFAVVSDVFDWGTADMEEIHPANLAELSRAYDDLLRLDAAILVAELYAARIRRMRPQGAWYRNRSATVAALFNGCGPERPISLTNPASPDLLNAMNEYERADYYWMRRSAIESPDAV